MMFSTKAEYGVRVMVELARGVDGEPVPLAEIAARGGLPLAYL
jgi:DNA-binding IscR family transcriptional regulator